LSYPILLVAALIVAPRSAYGGDDRALMKVAQQQIKLGESQFKADQFGDAAKSFLKAVDLIAKTDRTPPPALYRSIARCHEHLGEVMPALEAYKKFLGLVDKTAKAERAVSYANDAVRRLQALVDKTAITFGELPPKTQVRIDGTLVGTSPIERVAVRPGARLVALQAPGYEPKSIKLEVSAGSEVPLLFELRRKQPAGGGSEPDSGVAAEAPPSPRSSGGGWLGWALGGAAVGLGVAAVVTTLDASGQEADADERRKGCQPSSDCDASDPREVNDKIETAYADAGSKRNVALVMGVAGVGALAAAVWLWTADSGADASAAGAAGWGLVPIALPMTRGISLHASF
jgi:hypothetical protein